MSADQLNAAWEQIEHWLATHKPRWAKRLSAGADSAAIDACAAAMGVAFPDDLRASLARHGAEGDHGLAPLIGKWSLLDLDGIAAEHRIMRSLLDRGELGAPAAPNPRLATCWWHRGWIPIVSSGSGHQICVDTAPGPAGRHGQVILFLHDSERRFCLADSLTDWWTAIARGLADGSLGYDPATEKFIDEAFLSIALEGRDLYRRR